MYVCTEETKAVKRNYQKMQEDEDDEDDDYRNYTSPRITGSSATQLVGFQEICPEITVFKPHLSLGALFCPHIPADMSAARADVVQQPQWSICNSHSTAFRRRSWWRRCKTWRTLHQVMLQFARRLPHCHRKFRMFLCWRKSRVSHD